MNSKKTIADVELQLMEYPVSTTYTFGGRDYVPEETYDYYEDIVVHNREVYKKRINDLIKVISVSGLADKMNRRWEQQTMDYPGSKVYTFQNRRYVPVETIDYYNTIIKHNCEVYMRFISDLEDMIFSEDEDE